MSLHKLHPRLQDFVKEKWKRLTKIQEKAFDPIYEGNSCIIEAPTSGGKTEAVLFPLLTRIASHKTAGFKVLYIAPLKALLNDLALRVLPHAERCYMEAFKWHGDVSQADKVQQMTFPADILLTTPESIEAILLRRANWNAVFRNLETIVIDEAHYFALTERGSHLLSLLERLEAGIPNRPQRIAVTATVGNPGDLLRWLLGGRSGGECIRIEAENAKERDFKIHFFEEEKVPLHDNLYTLLQKKKSIVFERSRSGTEDTASKINERNLLINNRFPIKVKTHHSSVSKRLREEAEGSIKKESTQSIDAIISTSTLELGIDIGDLDQVIQIGGLSSASSFLQRVGRTGRRDGRPQFFRGLCNDSEELLLLTGCVSLGINRYSEAILLPTRAFHILAHQTICYSIQNLGATADQIWNAVSNAYCFSKIKRSEFDLLIDYMLQEDFLRLVERSLLIVSKTSEDKFLRANYKRLFAIFDASQMYNVVDGKKVIGTLDSDFARSQQLPFIFVLGGLEWNAIKLDHEQQQISVEKNETGIPPKWTTINSFDVPFEVAQEIGKLLMNDEKLEFLDLSAHRVINALRSTFGNLNWRSGKWIMEGSSEAGTINLWNFAGDKINRCLHTLLKHELGDNLKYDYQKVIIYLKDDKSIDEVYDLIMTIGTKTENELLNIIEANIPVKWFSKFSECLPDELSKRTIIDKGMDVAGLIRQLNEITIDY
ncbi:DEAD/DEAH box helicase [Chitinophaga sp. S165]|uniref:DEAD/DEAH box helicase n=1 Tax=Chitinophaga sp. S165 TaxID=2135462 RepID=UPI000D718B22|nr:DEAD/DEAH box helicase [Chitinophaga sp. S165]PWV49511.1 ATP-dependent Lhr-like helicase [Chitinophaga sp. S165]